MMGRALLAVSTMRPGPSPWEGVKTTLSLKECLLGVWHWPEYRLLGRCWAQGCGRLMILHSPWALYDCSRTPMAITLTEAGMACVVIAEAEDLIA